MRTWIHDNLCCLTIKSDTQQHSQFLRCFAYTIHSWLTMVVRYIYICVLLLEQNLLCVTDFLPIFRVYPNRLWNLVPDAFGNVHFVSFDRSSYSDDVLLCIYLFYRYIRSLIKCSTVQMFKCSNIQLFNCSNVQMFKYSNIQMFNWPNVKNLMSNVNKIKLFGAYLRSSSGHFLQWQWEYV